MSRHDRDAILALARRIVAPYGAVEEQLRGALTALRKVFSIGLDWPTANVMDTDGAGHAQLRSLPLLGEGRRSVDVALAIPRSQGAALVAALEMYYRNGEEHALLLEDALDHYERGNPDDAVARLKKVQEAWNAGGRATEELRVLESDQARNGEG